VKKGIDKPRHNAYIIRVGDDAYIQQKERQMTQTFNAKQQNFINNGISAQDMLRDQLNNAFFNNVFDETTIISSQPGLGKTYEMKKCLANAPEALLIEGSSSMAFFTIQIATAVFLAGNKPLTIVLDDCDVIFEDANTNTAKKMFDETRKLKYNKMRKSLKSFCNELQWEAIEHFGNQNPENPGFEVPLNNVTFIVLTNRMLPTANQVDALENGSKRHSTATDLFAIRRRTACEPIEMELYDLWGYVANVSINEKICDKFMPNVTAAQKEQIANWLFYNWDRVTERNLSIVEKMTKAMVRFPTNYLDIWESKFIEV